MKAKYIVTLLLVGMFAIGVPVGAVADNGDNLVTDAFGETFGEIEGPLGTGALISQDNRFQQSQDVDESDPYAIGEFDDGGA